MKKEEKIIEKQTNNKKKRIIKALIAIFIVIALLFGACAIYVNDYYRADVDAMVGVVQSKQHYEPKTLEDGTNIFKPENAKAGFIFYPGGKVEYTSYIPLMDALARKGIMCVLLKMPFNLAVLDVNGAEGIKEMFPEIENWYIGGHSLGGSMAATYLAENISGFDGLILLGSYSTADLSKEDVKVLSVFGSEDKVMNKDKYDENKINLPKDFSEEVINGGCHAYFGMYGEQDGDGTPTITNEEQIQETANIIKAFINE